MPALLLQRGIAMYVDEDKINMLLQLYSGLRLIEKKLADYPCDDSNKVIADFIRIYFDSDDYKEHMLTLCKICARYAEISNIEFTHESVR